MKEYIKKVSKGQNLTVQEMQGAMHQMMSGEVAAEDFAEFLLALRKKGASVDEITGAAMTMREFSVPVNKPQGVVLDVVGTGGDKKGTFNISTITAFVAAGAGCTVAKHGNRSVSSKCGAADVLEKLGVNIQMDVSLLELCLKDVGIAFLFAQKLHPAMKHAAPVRKSLKVETIFNILGPLTNPARSTHQLVGVYDKLLIEPMAHVLKNLGIRRAMVVHGQDGSDEITTTTSTFVCEYDGEKMSSYVIDPQRLGIAKASEKDLRGSGIEENTQIAIDILDGGRGPKRDIVVLNAAHALYVAEAAKTVEEGIKLASDSIDSGRAKAKLETLKQFTNS
ncbi:MAG: anthranilate phosphoribosyltransferase [Candidatus Aceula meridiana]|nr:anthranilate phosphoribosyltransferase [Candidatus Aceula meridiana]